MSEDGQTDGVSVTSVDNAEGSTEGEGQSFLSDASSFNSSERKTEPLRLKTKPIPAVVMLLGGGIVTADVFIQQIEFRKSLIIILVSLVVFLFAGELVKYLLDRIELPNPDAVHADGNVIQKGKSGDTDESGENPENRDLFTEGTGE